MLISFFINESLRTLRIFPVIHMIFANEVSTCDLVKIGGENVRHVKRRWIVEEELTDIWFNQWDVQTV